MKTSELTGWQLDLWVARALGYTIQKIEGGRFYHVTLYSGSEDSYLGTISELGELPLHGNPFSPSTSWELGGPLIDKFEVGSQCFKVQGKKGEEWAVQLLQPDPSNPPWHILIFGYGETLLIAAMRAIVTEKFGEELTEEIG